MTFSQFLNNNIFPVFGYIINWLTQLLNYLLSNYIFKIIIFFSITTFIISIVKNIINIILNKTNTKEKDKGN